MHTNTHTQTPKNKPTTTTTKQIEDEALRQATEAQIAYFGQCPIQLLPARPHPPRDVPAPIIYRPLRGLLRQVRAFGGRPVVDVVAVAYLYINT